MAFTPLTKEQYQKAIDAGFSHQQIIQNELRRKQEATPSDTAQAPTQGMWGGIGNAITGVLGATYKGLSEFGAGLGTTIARTGIQIGELPEKGIQKVASAFGDKQMADIAGGVISEQEKLKKGITEPYKEQLATIPGKVGQLAGQSAIIGEATPSITAGKEIAGTIGKTIGLERIGEIPLVGKTTAYLTQKILNAVPDAVAGFGFGLSQEQKPSEAAKTGVLFGTFSTMGEMVGDAFRAYKGSLADNVNRAFGMIGKMTPTVALEKTGKAINALKRIVSVAPDITVVDSAGVEKSFDPANATFSETLQAYTKTRDILYKAYTDLATQAGDAGARFTQDDFQNVIKDLEDVAKDSTSGWKNKAVSLIKDLEDNFGIVDEKTGEVSFVDTSLERIQNFVQKINKDVNPVSDSAGAEVSGTASRSMREILDDKITSSTGEQYQKLRDAYSDLKSIETGLVNNFKRASVGVKGGFAKYIEGYGNVDIIVSLLTQNPAELSRGIGLKIWGVLSQQLRDPETQLQNAFQKLAPQVPSLAKTVAKTTAGNIGKIIGSEIFNQ